MNDPSKVESILLAALEQATAEARSAYLDDVCQGNPTMREHVNRLLAAHPKAVEFLEQPAGPAGEKTAAYIPAGEESGAIVAERYKLLEKIGEGGMGEVWVADQHEPIRRRVALKLIKPGMDSRSVLARFEAERQALAVMDHPNIAKVLDAGTTADGRPYFVMELVKGTPITKFCDARKLTPKQRLELFVPVCHAIQHAHMKGIIHRDIKPSNVLVALHDETPMPKVIDFGVAKAVGQQLTEKTIYTGFGALVGTPAYMAPEQATFNQLDIDTRADVYALGVLLYELLAGSPPVEPERMKQAALDEVLRLVRDEEPPRPSQRLSTSQAKASIAATRQSDPITLAQLIRGELDWIVMKALEKDRNRRYDTANGLAADVQRYLAGEQVQAVPPSTSYRLRKFARKNRVVLSTAVAFALLLIASAAVSGWLAVQARQSEAVAEEKRIEARANAEEADHNAKMYAAAAMDAETARQEADLTAASRQVDLDLVETRTDLRVGLLRLLQTLKTISGNKSEKRIETFGPKGPMQVPNMVFSDQRELRQLVTAVVLTQGQEFAPLLSPIKHDGQNTVRVEISPDSRRLLTYGADQTVRLWESRAARPIATLRQADERVVNLGFDPNGRTIFTDDQHSIARFWDAENGQFVAATEARPNRYELSEKWYGSAAREANAIFLISASRTTAQIHNNRLLTKKIREVDTQLGASSYLEEGPVELWDTDTGRFITRLDKLGDSIPRFKFLGDGRFIMTIEETSSVSLFSAVDGRLLARLEHPADEAIDSVAVSPSGRRVATTTRASDNHMLLRMWNSEDWNSKSEIISLESLRNLRFLTEELFTANHALGIAEPLRFVYRIGEDHQLGFFYSDQDPFLANDLALVDGKDVYDVRTWQRLRPPSGRRLHPDLVRFASDGRFVLAINDRSERLCVDTLTQKEFIITEGWSEHRNEDRYRASTLGFIAGLGSIWAIITDNGIQIRLFPQLGTTQIPPAALELWAQVAVRGELSAEGEFVKWDEPTWEKKRQELVAIPPPHPGMPFPGYVATDKLHWLRSDYNVAPNDADKQRLAQELLRRAEDNGDQVEVIRWRAALAPFGPTADPAAPPVSK